MSGLEKRANLSSGLLAVKGAAAPKRIERAGETEGAAVIAIAGHRGDAAPPASGDALLYRKGAASAQGFRPPNWSFDRAEEAAAAPSRPRAHAARASLIAILGFLALSLSTGVLVLARHRDTADFTPSATVARAPDSSETVLPLPPASPPRLQSVEADATAGVTSAPVSAALKPAASPGEIEAMIARGNELIATGDIASARLFFQRAAERGSARAATAVGLTYDPIFLAQARVRGVTGDTAAAERWYRSAIAAGDPQAEIRLQQLLAKTPH